MAHDDGPAAGQRLGGVPDQLRSRRRTGPDGELGETRVVAETEAGGQHATVGVGLHDDGGAPPAVPHRPEGEGDGGGARAAVQRTDGDDAHAAAPTRARVSDLAAAADATAGAAASGTSSDTIHVPVVSSSARTS